MAKITMEFDDIDDNDDIQLIICRNKIRSALDDITNYRRKLYKGWNTSYIIVKDDEVVYKDGQKIKEYDIENTKSYVSEQSVINELDNILEPISFLLY